MAIEHPQQPLGIASPAESVGTDVLSLMAAPQGSFGDTPPHRPVSTRQKPNAPWTEEKIGEME